ncbi:MAG TPA: hypothetical protein VK922_01210 [Gemmatimonadaceae bacterium]|nr:hypothetical protein [Gemmatimonadaceae bacterium]
MRQFEFRSDARPAVFIYVAGVLTAAMLIFPPFTGLRGLEYAYLLTGPELARGMSDLAVQLGLGPRIHWPALLVQLAILWTLALGLHHVARIRNERSAPGEGSPAPPRDA